MSDKLESMIVAEVMNCWPQTVPVFVRHRMACPGCVMAPFMTVAEASKEYGLDAEILAAELAVEIRLIERSAPPAAPD